MTTMVVRIERGANARNIAAAMRQLKGVAEVKMQHNGSAFERIPEVPHTQEELIESVTNAMAGYRRGEKGMSQQELLKEIAIWK